MLPRLRVFLGLFGVLFGLVPLVEVRVGVRQTGEQPERRVLVNVPDLAEDANRRGPLFQLELQ